MMLDLARRRGTAPMLRHHRDGGWHTVSWGEFGRLAAACARGLRQAGVSAGDRVLICAENRPEYPIAETALMAIRAVPVPVYTTNTVEDHAHILRDCGARAAIVSSVVFAGRIREAAATLQEGWGGGLELLVIMDPGAADPAGADPAGVDPGKVHRGGVNPGGAPAAAKAPAVLAWEQLVAERPPQDDIEAEAAGIPPTALACLIYTSGTGGAPKGVMLPHRCILSNCRGAFELVRPLKLENETYLSYLPLSHSYEHTVGQFFLLSIGTEIVYCRGVEHLAADMLAVRPTILTAVPRVLAVIRSRILTQIAREKPWRQSLFHRALALGGKRIDGARLSVADRVADAVLDRLVRTKVQARFGGRLIAAMSGGARLDPDVGRFFLALGIKIMQGYGQTEAGPVISANPPDDIRIETVGRVLRGVQLQIAPDREILVSGDLVMDGYWGLPDETARVIRDGWLHTGDIGVLDRDGYLRITDRKKDMIVLSGGEKVSPARIEGLLMADPAIAQAVVAGDGRAGVSALVVPAEGCDELAVAAAVNRTNMRLSVTERVRKHATVGPFTIENGLLTPTQKIRRTAVIHEHATTLARLHGGT